MSVFKINDFNQIGVTFENNEAKVLNTILSPKKKIKLPKTMGLMAMKELSFNVQVPPSDLLKSNTRWGLFLNSITLKESFEGYIANLFNPQNEIYFTAICWDYSGNPPFVYPPVGSDPALFSFNLRVKETERFFGDGANLYPPSIVTGSLNCIIMIYENDEGVRQVGEVLTNIHDKVSSSKLSGLVQAISIGNPALATGVAITEAVTELLGVIGNIMKMDQNDYVDTFEGSYGTDRTQVTKKEKLDNPAAAIEFTLTVAV